MEAMNTEVRKMIDDLEIYKAIKQESARKAGSADQYGYPFERFDAFSDAPLDFTENAIKLYSEAGETYLLLRQINRHSPLFYQMSEQLEKLVGQLGSVCVTKAVMEKQSGKPVDYFEELTIDWLRGITAFNFRKCYKAFMESNAYLEHNVKALALSIRWSALDKRLIATAEKINKIMSGEVKIDISEKESAEKKNLVKDQGAENAETVSALSHKSSALPIDKTALRDMETEQAEGCSELTDLKQEEKLAEDMIDTEANPVTEAVSDETSEPDVSVMERSAAAEDPNINEAKKYLEETFELPDLSGAMILKLLNFRSKREPAEWPP